MGGAFASPSTGPPSGWGASRRDAGSRASRRCSTRSGPKSPSFAPPARSGRLDLGAILGQEPPAMTKRLVLPIALCLLATGLPARAFGAEEKKPEPKKEAAVNDEAIAQ